MTSSKSQKLLFANLTAILILLLSVYPVHSQQGIVFKNHRAETTFLESIRFTVDLCELPPDAKVYLNVRLSHESWQNLPAFKDEPEAQGACARGRYTYQMTDYPPFIPIEYYWQVNPSEGGYIEGPRQSALYEDTRFNWEKLEGDKVTVYWHDRPARLGEQILEIAEKANQSQSQFFGLDLNYPYRIVIFNTEEEFFGWNVVSSDYVAGESYPFFDLTVQIVEDDSLDWLNEVIPHEVSHLYFNQATFHPKPKSFPPAWLDEGVAVYNEYPEYAYEDQLLEQALREDGIIPLHELAYTFGEDTDRVDLAYAEGYSAVSYLMEQYGRDTLKELMNSYRKGVSKDEAFASAMNKSSLEFEREWEDWLKTKYSKEQQEFSVDEIPVFEQTSPGRNISLYLALCALGFAPFFCLTTVAVGALVGILLKQGLRS